MNLKSISHELAGDICAIVLLTLPLSLTLLADRFGSNVVFETSNRISVPVATQQYLDLIDGRIDSISTDRFSISRRLDLPTRILYLDVFDLHGSFLGSKIHLLH